VSSRWNSHTIDPNFLPFEGVRIKAIPIYVVAQEDTLIWPKSKDGPYSVKTSYKLLSDE